MGIPVKALKESSFGEQRVLVGDGSHQIWRVNFVENGTVKSGFFKKLDPDGHFPELLAKISVATSVIKQLFQDKSAEERLVFDEFNNIVGTLSIGLKDFRPFNFSDQEKPTNPSEKEKVIPSKETLIQKNIIETLLGRWFLGDDDTHPHNLSLEGDIDFDMFWHWFVIFMKGARPGIELPKKKVDLTVRDYERFPRIRDSKPYHWPTYDYPGQESITSVLPEIVQKPILSATMPSILPKVYADPAQFAALAADPEAQQQKVKAALKILLSFQPDLLRKRLRQALDDLTLNYTSLPPALREKYEKEFPMLCNEKANKEPFVEFMMKMFQAHYDNLYRVVVFYMGCENNGCGVPLLPTHEALYIKPSLYKDIEAWAKERNKDNANEPENQYNLGEMERRYHQIWRDSHTLKIKQIIKSARNLTFDIGKLATEKIEVDELISKEVTDESLTNAWQVLGIMPDIKLQSSKNEKGERNESSEHNASVFKAWSLLTQFTNQLQHIVTAYYEKDKLEKIDNKNFITALEELWKTNDIPLREALAYTTSHATKFVRIRWELKEFIEQVAFDSHLHSTDEQMQEVRTIIKKNLLPLEHTEVLGQFSETLFQWADSLSAEAFIEEMDYIIDRKYAPTIELLSNRKRALPVREYLKKSTESNANKLAYILSSGNAEGALNTCIIRELTPKMLQTNYVPSVMYALKDGRFETNINLFVKATASYAAHNQTFTHLYSPKGVELFFETFYQWFAEIPSYRRDYIVNAAMATYELGLSTAKSLFWGSTSKATPIKMSFRQYANDPNRALALAFLDKGEASTANVCLFREIVKEIKADIEKNKGLKDLPGYKLIDLLQEEQEGYYLKQLKNVITIKKSQGIEEKVCSPY